MTDRIRVLQVDDRPDSATTAATALEHTNGQLVVETVASHREALEKIDAETVDCLVLGIDTTDPAGAEFLATVSDGYPTLPILLVSPADTDTHLVNRIHRAVGDPATRSTGPPAGLALDSVFERITDGFFAVDSAWRYTYVNDAGAEIVGHTSEQLLGERVWDVFPDLDGSAFGEALRTTMDTGETTSVEEQFPSHDAWYDVRVYPAHDGISIYFRDVTDRVVRERELERRNQKLDSFVGIVAHDLRNPLQVAIGRLEAARTDCRSDHLDHVETALTRSTDLIEDLLAVARGGTQPLDLEQVDFGALVSACWKTVETDTATLQVETNRVIQADPARLRHLVENLIRNSVEHSSTGNRTESGDSVEHGGTELTITVGHLPDGAGVFVADNGSGIPNADREQIFEDGYSTSSAGTGFGLSIVKSIAEEHGWQVSVTESETGGARFEITGIEISTPTV